MVVHCRWWSMPIWVGMICLSVGIFSSPTLFAASTINWNADRAIDALGPARKVKWSDGIITYPATGKATLKDVFPTLSMQWGSSKTLDQVEFRLKAGHGEIFKVPRVVSGRYECSIEAKFTNGRPGVAIVHLSVSLNEPYPDANYSELSTLKARTTGNQDDESVAKAKLSDLSFDMSCQGVDFSWERKADEKVEFETQNVHAPVGILIDGGDIMWWSRPILPTIKDPVTVISPPECIFESQSSEDFDLGEIRREPSDAIFPKELHRATVQIFDLLISVVCDTPNKDDTGVAIVNFSTEYLGVDGKSIVMDTNSKTGGKDFDNALAIKVLPRVLGIQTKLVGGNQIGQPVTFGSVADPKSVLVFNVDDKSAVEKTKNNVVYYSHHSLNKFSVQLWQTKAIDPKLSGEFKTSMEATLVMK